MRMLLKRIHCFSLILTLLCSRFEEVLEDEAPKLLKRPRESDVMETDEQPQEKLSKAEKKKRNKKLKAEGGQAVATGESISSASKAGTEDKKSKRKEQDTEKVKEDKKSKKKEQDTEKVKEKKSEGKKDKHASRGEEKELGGGLKVTDVKIGNGPQAKKGNTVSMRYIGKLPDGSVFDKNTSGKPVRLITGSCSVFFKTSTSSHSTWAKGKSSKVRHFSIFQEFK
jgi:FK506-binding nuclear protein